jgi:lysophospholipase L1-like esterase
MSRRHRVLACLVIPTLLTLLSAAPAAAATDTHSLTYVALGDSYSAGVGAPGQSGLCLVGSSGYPALWARNNTPRSYLNLACNGATTDTVQLTQIPFLPAKAGLVTITVGGNDAGFVPAVTACILATDAGCAAVVATAHAFITGKLEAKLDATYAAIKRRAPRAEVVVLGYPLLFDTSLAACGISGLSVAKRRSLNSGAQDLDELAADRARAAGFRFADVRDTFAGHGACATTPWINGLTVVPVTNSFHPNAAGYASGYLPALNRALG